MFRAQKKNGAFYHDLENGHAWCLRPSREDPRLLKGTVFLQGRHVRAYVIFPTSFPFVPPVVGFPDMDVTHPDVDPATGILGDVWGEAWSPTRAAPARIMHRVLSVLNRHSIKGKGRDRHE
jgi:ubiquitin-protein ligase